MPRRHKMPPGRAPIEQLQDDWARTWGETVSKVGAAAMLGISRDTVYDWLSKGYLIAAPNGRINVREAARWVNAEGRA